ncbi:MAG TPA: hypothetical protein VND89_09940 [Acidimicrobiales bacterium]|nr:hypothetical protein [Acidimicrobiales bacterium]
MSRHPTLALRQQKRRWLTVVVVALTLLATSLVFSLATLPSQPLRIEWGRPAAVRIPPIRGLNDETSIDAISCTTATACSAGGFVSTSTTTEAVVIDESKGLWQKAHVIKGTSTSSAGDNATISAISCASPGNCSAGGSFVNGEGLGHSPLLGYETPRTAFVVNEVHGRWTEAQAITGVVAPGIEDGATISYLSCASDGNCAAAGSFASLPCADGYDTCVLAGATYKRQFAKSFVVNEVGGIWKSPEWLHEANRGEYPRVNGLSCGAPGACAAVGTSLSSSRQQEGFVVDETNGRWQTATLFPGSALRGQTSSALNAVSCGSRGNCSAGGSYTDRFGKTHPFIVDETTGTWRRAAAVRGSTRPALKPYALVQSISCGTSSDCTAFGESLGGKSKGLYYFVLTKSDGAWSSVRLVPGAAPSTFRGFSGSEMACSANESCTIAGSYFTQTSPTHPYALSENIGHFTRLVSLRGVVSLNLEPTAGSVVALSCGAMDNCVIVEEFSTMGNESSFLVHEFPR